MRVPVPDGSLTDITCVLTKIPTPEQINKAFKLASETDLKGILLKKSVLIHVIRG